MYTHTHIFLQTHRHFQHFSPFRSEAFLRHDATGDGVLDVAELASALKAQETVLEWASDGDFMGILWRDFVGMNGDSIGILWDFIGFHDDF